MPRVLDIDLDFFMDTIVSVGVFDRRRQSNKRQTWSEQEVRTFLEQRCGLSTAAPILAGFGIHHHEAFEFLRERIASDNLATPFEIVHIDGHADLGAGVGGLDYLRDDVLYRPLQERSDVAIGKKYLNPGNYLLFAIACRWVSQLTYVTHPSWDTADIHMPIYHGAPPNQDIQVDEAATAAPVRLSTVHIPKPPSAVRLILESLGKEPAPSYEFRRSEGTIRLAAAAKKGSALPAEPEPDVPFRTVSGALYGNNGQWDLMFLSQSPAYTPSNADSLIPVILSYGNLVNREILD